MEGTDMKKYMPVLGIFLLCILLYYVAMWVLKEPDGTVEEAGGGITEGEKSLYAGTALWLGQELSLEDRQALIKAFTIEEEDVYTFLQGPKSWGEGRAWSGEWSQFGVEGNPFGGFGCGLCCLANIYNTLSPYEVSPWGMYGLAREVSKYAPDGKYGAIDWEPMQDTLRHCGIRSRILKKPKTYRRFRSQIRRAKSAIVLISSGDDDTYWQDTPGHYVNIWLYREEDGTVFLAEPGNPENNRTRIPLRYIYDALKSISRYQYLLVDSYVEEDNQWKGDGILESWNRP